MKKSIIIITILTAAIAAVSTVLFYKLSINRNNRVDALTAVPMDAPILIKINRTVQIPELIAQNIPSFKIAELHSLINLSKTLLPNDSSSFVNTPFFELLQNNPVYLAIGTNRNNSTPWCVAVNIPGSITYDEIIRYIKLTSIDRYRISDTDISGCNALTLFDKTDKSKITITQKKTVLLLSNSQQLVEQALQQIARGKSLLSKPQFHTAYKVVGKDAPANLLVHFNKLNRFQTDSTKTITQRLYDMGEWAELDIKFGTNKLLLNGIITVSDSLNSFLRIFTSQPPGRMSIPEVLPEYTHSFIWMNIADIPRYFETYRSYLNQKGLIFRYTQSLSRLGKKIGHDPEEIINRITDREIALVSTKMSNAIAHSCFLIVRTKSPSKTVKLLQSCSETSLPSQSITLSNGVSLKVYRSPIRGIFQKLFGSIFEPITDSHFCTIDRYVVFGSSTETLTRFANTYYRNLTLPNNPIYRRVSTELTRNANLLLYINPITSGNSASSTIPLQGFPFPRGSETAICQLIGGNTPVFVNIGVWGGGSSVRPVIHQPHWICNLDSKPVGKPQPVINHNTHAKEFAVQDELNRLYLIDANGRILWKRALGERIMGKISQVDLYKNGKLQLAFNTRSKLFIIDRNGKDVKGFPITYPSYATNPLFIADYDKNKEYRFFQACENRRIYLYNRHGKRVKGWKFNRTETVVTGRMGYVRVKGKDYLIVFDRNRVYLLNRRGEERVKPRKLFGKAPHSNFRLGISPQKGHFIVTTDTNGIVRKIFLTGKVEEQIFRKFSGKHAFDYYDLDGDGSCEYIFVDNSSLYVYGSNGKSLFCKTLPHPPLPEIFLFDFGKRTHIGLIDPTTQKNYLFNTAGENVWGFPFNGITPFTITRLSPGERKFYIITGHPDGAIISYSLNNI